ncbi:endothelial differentiation-related factor 1-like isoform X2 [Tursiops truncatus]|uniref:Endothelial differentiation-related factor 1-like isoform X2 n=2 Tax=Delphinidae TaxID=9726 RepID=A0A2U4AYA2_TURTR|nr:endothelial differentiation-related factor 1-like isoform X2 [Tursiops truncatus]
MAESDWPKKGPMAAQAKAKSSSLAAQRGGEYVEASKKWAAGQNKQHWITKNTAKLDLGTEELHHDRVSLEDLATKINEKPQVVADRERGRAISNNQALGKIE